MTRIRAAAAIVLLLWVARLHASSITISPAAVYLDRNTRTTKLTLYNPGDVATEVTLTFAFGYPQSDANGNVSVPLSFDPQPGEPSAHQWLRAFPRRVLLQPGRQQVVRVIAEPPPNLADGEYWARLVVTTRGSDAPAGDAEGVAAQVNVVNRLITAANYRNGAVTTGVEVTRASARRDTEDRVLVDIDLQRKGNAAFLGRLRADVIDANGSIRGTASHDVAVYRTMLRRFAIDVAPGTGGPLQVRVTITPGRDDLPPGAALPAAAVTHTVPVTP